jgi:hypothetical protein
LVCVAGFVLSVVGAFTILTLKSRLGIVRPWFGDALSGFQALLLFFCLGMAVFKFFASMSSGSGDSSEQGRRQRFDISKR